MLNSVGGDQDYNLSDDKRLPYPMDYCNSRYIASAMPTLPPTLPRSNASYSPQELNTTLERCY